MSRVAVVVIPSKKPAVQCKCEGAFFRLYMKGQMTERSKGQK